jgi:hypothetical protein
VFTVETNAGELYSIVRAGEMTPCGDILWEAVTTFMGNGGEMEIALPNSPTAAASFYRLAAP